MKRCKRDKRPSMGTRRHLSPDHIRAAVERLAHPTCGTATATKTGADGMAATPQNPEVREKIGAPGRNRTPDPRLRSSDVGLSGHRCKSPAVSMRAGTCNAVIVHVLRPYPVVSNLQP